MSKKGLLLVNLGSPNSPSTKDVKSYLDEFLMDEYVIDLPLWLRSFIVRGIILNTRPKKSAEAYRRIWWKEGSPLIVITKRLQDKVKRLLGNTIVEISMRYGNPGIEHGIRKMSDMGVNEIIMLPLYPQYAMATTKTILVLAENIRKMYFPNMTIRHIPAFYHRKSYLDVLANNIVNHLKDRDVDMLLFSYHGVPKRHIRKTDITHSHCKTDDNCCSKSSVAHEFCYRHQCYHTTQEVAKRLGLKPSQIMMSFQSRLGVDPWLQPYTDQTIADMPSKGVKKLAVVMPAFVSDCLETIEEIGIEAKETFLENGGETFYTVPCLNDDDDWAALISKWTKEFLSPQIAKT